MVLQNSFFEHYLCMGISKHPYIIHISGTHFEIRMYQSFLPINLPDFNLAENLYMDFKKIKMIVMIVLKNASKWCCKVTSNIS